MGLASSDGTSLPSPIISKQICKSKRKKFQINSIESVTPGRFKKLAKNSKLRAPDTELTIHVQHVSKTTQNLKLIVKRKSKVSEILQKAAELIQQKNSPNNHFQGDLRYMLIVNEKILPNKVDLIEVENKFKSSKGDRAFVFAEKGGAPLVLWPLFQVCDVNHYEEVRQDFPYSTWKFF